METLSTASQKSFDAVRRDGSKEVFDYHNSNVVSQIQEKVPDLSLIFDTIGSPASTKQAGEIFGSRNGSYCTVRPGKAHCEDLPQNVHVSDVFVFTAFPKEHSYRGKAFWPVSSFASSLVPTCLIAFTISDNSCCRSILEMSTSLRSFTGNYSI